MVATILELGSEGGFLSCMTFGCYKTVRFCASWTFSCSQFLLVIMDCLETSWWTSALCCPFVNPLVAPSHSTKLKAWWNVVGIFLCFTHKHVKFMGEHWLIPILRTLAQSMRNKHWKELDPHNWMKRIEIGEENVDILSLFGLTLRRKVHFTISNDTLCLPNPWTKFRIYLPRQTISLVQSIF
jgi:hypothetical protein